MAASTPPKSPSPDFKSQIADLLGGGENRRAAQLLSARVLSGPAIHEYPWLGEKLAVAATDAFPIRIGVLSTFTVESIQPFLRAIGLAHGLAIDAYYGPFGQLETEMMNPASGLGRHAPAALFIAWQLADLSPALWNDSLELSADEATHEADEVLARIRTMIDAGRRSLPRTQFVLHTLLARPHGILGIIDFEHAAGQHAIVARLNDGLRAVATSTDGVHLLDSAAVAQRAGAAWYDARYWYRARAPFGPAALIEMATEYVRFARAVSGKTRKVLVTDLDNTLWGGILGEDGLDGIRLGPDFPGNAFVAYQQELRSLSRRGIVLAINSKNNEADVREAFERHPGMVLKWDDFAAKRVNWQDKARNMRELSRSLSLGLDSFVFVDDNPVELEIIQQELPEVATVLVPREPAELPGLITRMGFFESIIFSDEDRKRNEYYRADAGREELRHASSDLESFWRSLNMKLTVYAVGAAEIPRVAQLTQRTNQFNTTTRRYSESDIAAFCADPACAVRAYGLEDKFGDNGVIAVVIAKTNGADWVIDTFLMSCRVIGRTVERTILALLSAEAATAGATRLIGDFLPTKKNAPAKDVYPMNGFEVLQTVENGGIRYVLHFAKTALTVPDWMAVMKKGV